MNSAVQYESINYFFVINYSGRCYVSGWGQDIKGKFQPILREVDLPIVDEFECEERLRTTRLGRTFNLDKNSFLCAGGEEGKDACKVKCSNCMVQYSFFFNT